MRHLLPQASIFIIGYALGSIPFGLILTRMAGLGDVRKIGSGNIGATNVLRTGNKKLAAATLFLDGFKGTVAVWLTLWLLAAMLLPEVDGPGVRHAARDGTPLPVVTGMDLRYQLAALAGLGAFLGHIYPVWLGFRGGKGVATYIGILLGLVPLVGLLFCGLWLGSAYLTRYSSLSALIAAAVTPVVLWLTGLPLFAFLFALMTLLLYWKHRENISRLMNGTESKIGAKSAQSKSA